MNTFFALFNLGGGEIILILALILILFGARKLPELAKGLGQGIKEFKKATREVTDEIQSSVDENHYTPPPPKRIEEPAKVETAAHAESAHGVEQPVPQSTDKKV
jgi:sec-independent protein translocase protein TatA